MAHDRAQQHRQDNARAQLRPTSYAVLGILCFGYELSGYDMKKWADQSLQLFYWAPSYSQIYSELKRLEEQGLAVSRVVSKDDIRGKRLYAVTKAGRDAVTDWVNNTPVEPVVLKDSVLLRMWLGHLGEPDRLRELLQIHRQHTEELRQRAEGHAEGAAMENAWAFPELVLRSAMRHYESELERIDDMIERIDEVSERSHKDLPDEDAPPRPFVDTKLIDTKPQPT